MPQEGSPPRVRGKDIDITQIVVAVRITPACAGKSADCVIVFASGEDHPRVCGEKQSLRDTFPSPKGSPPRVRGKVDLL